MTSTRVASPIFTAEVAILRGQADRAYDVARMHGWELPKRYASAIAVADAAHEALNAPTADTLPELPDSAAQVPAWIKRVADERSAQDSRRVVARDMLGAVDGVIINSARACVGEWVAGICRIFADALAEFADLVGHAPHNLTGHESPEGLAAHASLLRCVGNLTAATTDRGTLAAFAGEGEEIGSDPVWLVLDPVDNASLDEIGALLKDHHGAFPSTLAQWNRLNQTGASMAGPGDVSARKEAFATAQQRRHLSGDMGVADRTFRELRAMQT